MIFWRYKLRKVWFFWIILFEFWLILFVSAAFSLFLLKNFPFSFCFYLFTIKNDFAGPFWCGFFWRMTFWSNFVVCIFGEYFFSVGNFRHILLLFWCQFFFRASPIFFLSCRIYSKILIIICGSLHLSLHIQCFYKDFWRFNAVITGAIFQAFFKVKGQFNFLKILMKTSGDSCLVPWIFFLLFPNSYVFL